MVQFVEDIELIAYHSCQPMGRGLCSKSRAAGAPRASRGLVLPREAWTRKTSPFFATCSAAVQVHAQAPSAKVFSSAMFTLHVPRSGDEPRATRIEVEGRPSRHSVPGDGRCVDGSATCGTNMATG